MGRAVVTLLLIAIAAAAQADEPSHHRSEQRSITDRSFTWPSAEEWKRAFSLRDYNTRVVVLGTALLGLAAGTIGSFALLRKRALMGDALSHATLPGIGLAFIASTAWGVSGKSLPVLLAGASATGVLGVFAILFLRKNTRLKEDAAMGIVLSVFFGAGAALLGVIQQMSAGHQAGLESFIYGKTASMTAGDAEAIAVAGAVVALACVIFFKEFRLLCFDDAYAHSQGFSITFLDVTMMALVVIVTVIGLQAVGLILVIALLIVPAAAARFSTERVLPMTLLSAAIGGVSAMIGAGMSAVFPRLPSGAMIVMVAAATFALSMLFGPARGVLPRVLRRVMLARKIGRQHLLRAIYEELESRSPAGGLDSAGDSPPVGSRALMAKRSWSAGELARLIRRAERESLVVALPDGSLRLTARGAADARRLVHEHRLWELYLITHADVAPSRVDREADTIEHILGPEMIAELETLLAEAAGRPALPGSPHPMSS
ncbi:MAG: iron chelate uptake ABC transporter family permease subunit [Pirellulales bacterium]